MIQPKVVSLGALGSSASQDGLQLRSTREHDLRGRYGQALGLEVQSLKPRTPDHLRVGIICQTSFFEIIEISEGAGDASDLTTAFYYGFV
jgi:hypothetical protein